MNWKTALLILILIIFSNCYAEELDRHRFGFSVEGGFSTTFPGGLVRHNESRQKIPGNIGGTFFYQYIISERFAIRPELGLYSYFFKISDPEYLDGGPYATLNGRIGITMIFYIYIEDKVSFPLGLTTFASSRFYDSAGKYETDFSENGKEVLKEDYFSGGIQMSLGAEITGLKDIGGGFSIFIRLGDRLETRRETTLLIPSFGAIISMFF